MQPSRRTRCVQALGEVGITDPATTAKLYTHQVSGGMAQRIAIARALAGEPKLLIADEPTTALDVTVQAEILDLLRELREQRGTALILVTHDLAVVADSCDRVAVIYAGQLVEHGNAEDVLAAPRHPYTAGLLSSMPAAATSGARLAAIPGAVPAPQDWPAWCRFEPRCPIAAGDCRDGAVPLTEAGPGRVSRCLHLAELAADSPMAPLLSVENVTVAYARGVTAVDQVSRTVGRGEPWALSASRGPGRQ
jgi:peptide/nickel transport system permease protein